MSNKRIIAILLIASLLSACSTVAPSNRAESALATCKNSPTKKHTYTSRTKKTNEKTIVWSIPPAESENKAAYGIQRLSFYRIPTAKVPHLEVLLLGKAKSIEYEAQVEKISQVKVYEAEPGATAFATTVFLGLPLVFFPGKMVDEAFGCTDEMS
jgi:hypothetical protein